MNLRFVLIGLGVIAGIYWWTNRNKYAGMVAAGWGGNAWGNIPTLINPAAIVGYSQGRPVYPPPNPGGMTGQPDLGTLN